MRIFEAKFPSGAKEFTLDLPAGAQVMCVRTHGPQPMLVALGDGDAKTTPRNFVLYSNSLLAARGAKVGLVADNATYVGWFDLGNCPWYVFELEKAAAK